MRKFTFAFIIMLGMSGIAMAQTIEDFESIKLNVMAEAPPDASAMSVVANPQKTGINTSDYVCKFLRGKDGSLWSGFWSKLPVAIDVTNNHFVHAKVWKPRITPLRFKLEKPGQQKEFVNAGNTTINAWEDIVFDVTEFTGEFPIIAFMPDRPEAPPVGLADDIVIYFDDIYVNNDPAVGSAPVKVIEDFETIKLNVMAEPAPDASAMWAFTPNPDKTGINTSDYVCKFLRGKDGSLWSGFWSSLPAPIDVTTNHFVHVKVWKPRITPLRFKLEKSGQQKEFVNTGNKTINAWEDVVFDVTEFSGPYPVIAFMPDRPEALPVGLADDIVIYFDDIVVNNDPNPSVALTLNVDMTGANLVTNDKVYVAGTFPDWVEPGQPGTIEMTDANADKIYTVTMVVPAGTKEFKFFKNAGWNGGEWVGPPNRSLVVTGDVNANFIWGSNGQVSVRDHKLSGKIQMYPNPVRDELNINSTATISKVVITNTVGKVVGNVNYTDNQTINTSNLSNGMYFVTFIGKDGSKVTQKLIKD